MRDSAHLFLAHWGLLGATWLSVPQAPRVEGFCSTCPNRSMQRTSPTILSFVQAVFINSYQQEDHVFVRIHVLELLALCKLLHLSDSLTIMISSSFWSSYRLTESGYSLKVMAWIYVALPLLEGICVEWGRLSWCFNFLLESRWLALGGGRRSDLSAGLLPPTSQQTEEIGAVVMNDQPWYLRQESLRSNYTFPMLKN